MSQPNRQDIPLTVGDKTYQLRFSVIAMSALQDRWGLDNDKEVVAKIQKGNLKDVVTVLWACMQTHHPELTEQFVMGMLDDAGATGLTTILNQVVTAASVPSGPQATGAKAKTNRV